MKPTPTGDPEGRPYGVGLRVEAELGGDLVEHLGGSRRRGSVGGTGRGVPRAEEAGDSCSPLEPADDTIRPLPHFSVRPLNGRIRID